MPSHLPAVDNNTVEPFAINFRAYQKRETFPIVAEMAI